MNTIRDFWNMLRHRWKNAMPKFFRRMMWICGLISGTALAAHESMALAGIQPHAWWLDVEPYLVAVPAGAMFACKFTQRYSGRPIDYDNPQEAAKNGGVKGRADTAEEGMEG